MSCPTFGYVCIRHRGVRLCFGSETYKGHEGVMFGTRCQARFGGETCRRHEDVMFGAKVSCHGDKACTRSYIKDTGMPILASKSEVYKGHEGVMFDTGHHVL